jgi:hypothetical protein
VISPGALALVLAMQAEPTDFRIKWEVGERHAFVVKETVFDPQNGTIGREFTETFEVKRLVLDRYDLRMVVEGPSLAEDTVIKIGDKGQMISRPIVPFSWFRLPPDPILPDQEFILFDKKFQTPFGITERTSVCILRRVDKLAGRDVAHFFFRSTLLGGNLSGGGSGSALVDAKHGRLIRLFFSYVLTVNESGTRRSVPVRIEVTRK